MKKIYLDLKSHVQEDFNLPLYVGVALFLIVTITINYKIAFEKQILNSYYQQPISLLYYTLFYMFAYYSVSIVQLIVNKRSHILKTSNYWLRSGFFLFLLGFSAFFHFHNNFTYEGIQGNELWFLKKLLIQLKPFLTIILPLFIFWFIMDRNKEQFYGFNLKSADLKPYMIMLAIMFPLIFMASFQPDFQYTYPILKPWKLMNVFGLKDWQISAIFEPFYGISFFSVELAFRGALVIGMAKILGKDAVLPMVVTYAFLHFGKPMGETIGSIFGGYILGVIALRTKHIFGGCIIHIGVAYLMELTALWQHYRP